MILQYNTAKEDQRRAKAFIPQAEILQAERGVYIRWGAERDERQTVGVRYRAAIQPIKAASGSYLTTRTHSVVYALRHVLDANSANSEALGCALSS